MNRHFHIYYIFDVHLFNMSTYRRNLKVGIELKNGIKLGQSVTNKKKVFICLFRMLGGFNSVFKEPKSTRNVLHILLIAQDRSATLEHFCRDSPNTNERVVRRRCNKIFSTRDKRNN